MNKLWYQANGKDIKDYVWARSYMQKLIDLYCFDSVQFKEPEDIIPDNLKEFIEIILKHYQYYHLTLGNILDLGDAFDYYLNKAFIDEFPDEYPIYPETDRRQLVLFICDNCIQSSTWNLLPEDVPFILECLNAPDTEIISMHDKLDKYFEQFDSMKRSNFETSRRRKVLNEQRQEAIAKGEPLPIRPMGIDIDPCYNTKVRIKSDYLTGNSDDEKIANRQAGYSSTPKGMSWHHLEDCKTMELMETGLHDVLMHTGGARKLRQRNKNE